jgi:hypothetical protein
MKFKLIAATLQKENEGKDLYLEMALPYSHGKLAETIVVPNEYINFKMSYIVNMYNTELVMRNNAEVRILNFFFK